MIKWTTCLNIGGVSGTTCLLFLLLPFYPSPEGSKPPHVHQRDQDQQFSPSMLLTLLSVVVSPPSGPVCGGKEGVHLNDRTDWRSYYTVQQPWLNFWINWMKCYCRLKYSYNFFEQQLVSGFCRLCTYYDFCFHHWPGAPLLSMLTLCTSISSSREVMQLRPPFLPHRLPIKFVSAGMLEGSLVVNTQLYCKIITASF